MQRFFYTSMKFTFLYSITFLSLFLLFNAFAQDKKGIVWNKQVVDFGNIQQGEVKTSTFTCYNYSDSALTIENILPSCGCIILKWQRTPIKPGDSTSIKIDFDSKGKTKLHTKTIAVYTNQGLFELFIKANISK